MSIGQFDINSFFSQLQLLVTAQREQNKHDVVITALHRCPTVTLLGAKTHPWKVPIAGRSFWNETVLQREISIEVARLQVSTFLQARICHATLTSGEKNTPEHCSKYSALVRCLDSGSSKKLQHSQCVRTYINGARFGPLCRGK